MSITQHHNQSPVQLQLPPAVSLPREHLAAIQHIINDALALQARTRQPPPPYNMQRPSEPQWFKPRMDMYESPSASGARPLITATFELPGLRKEDVHIEVVDDRMVVSGDRREYTAAHEFVKSVVKEATNDEEMNDGEEEKVASEPAAEESSGRAGYTVREIKRGRFRRVVPLPSGTKLEDVKASMHDGILSVTFPGAPRPVARSVPVA